jgi:hypothetical protein
MKRLDLDEVQPFLSWLAAHYKQRVPDAAESWISEELAKRRQMVAEFRRTRQLVQLELPLGE